MNNLIKIMFLLASNCMKHGLNRIIRIYNTIVLRFPKAETTIPLYNEFCSSRTLEDAKSSPDEDITKQANLYQDYVEEITMLNFKKENFFDFNTSSIHLFISKLEEDSIDKKLIKEIVHVLLELYKITTNIKELTMASEIRFNKVISEYSEKKCLELSNQCKEIEGVVYDTIDSLLNAIDNALLMIGRSSKGQGLSRYISKKVDNIKKNTESRRLCYIS